MIILSYYPSYKLSNHDSSVSIVKDGELIYSYEEEKISRIHRRESKYFPDRAIMSALYTTSIEPNEIDMVCICGPTDIYDPFDVRSKIEKYYGISTKNFIACPHHTAHTALSVLGSPYESCFHWTIDAGGEDECFGGFGVYNAGEEIDHVYTLTKPSLSVFYLLLTAVCGFGDFEEGKVMGLSAYGTVRKELYNKMRDKFHFDDFGHVLYDGEFIYKYPKINLKKYSHDEHRPHKVFQYIHDEVAPDLKEITDSYSIQDIAATGQKLVEDLTVESLMLIKKINKIDNKNIVLSGGFFNNILASQRIQEEVSLNVFVPPGVGDMGLSTGAALWASNKYDTNNFSKCRKKSKIFNPYLGPEFDNNEIERVLEKFSLSYTHYNDTDLATEVALAISNNKVVGWFQGRAEFGARALGARSVLANPASIDNKARVNQLLKRREWFMPYAPSILEEKASKFFNIDNNENLYYYMTSAITVDAEIKEKIPSAVHIDGTVRPQLVSNKLNERYHEMISKFHDITGIPLVLNTSFNRHGTPIVCTPRHAIEHLLEGVVDLLAIGNFIVINKNIQQNSNEELIPEDVLLQVLSIKKWYQCLSAGNTHAAKNISDSFQYNVECNTDFSKIFVNNLEITMSDSSWDGIALEIYRRIENNKTA